MDEFKQMQRAVWDAGDFGSLSPYIAQVGERIVKDAGVEAGQDVLDVACGTGNAAIPAAVAGATVTGLDLVPKLLEGGAVKAADAGVEIVWIEGDAEQLPFKDGSFDRVFSTFGHMFAPRHQQTADEMSRVCRDDAVIGIACWLAEGAVGGMFAATAPFNPPPPDYAEPPMLWGTEDHVREMFPSAKEIEFSKHSATIEYESMEGYAELFMENFGPMVMAKQRLGEGFAELRAAVLEVWDRFNEAEDGSFVLPQMYLQSIIRL